MARKRKGTWQRTGGVLRVRIPITTMIDGVETTERVWATPDQSLSDEAAQQLAQDLTDHFHGRVVSKEEVYAALRGDRPTQVSDFVTRIYLPTRVDQKTFKDQKAMWKMHVFPSLGARDVRVFDSDDLRRLVLDLDRKSADGEISWKHAVNVWGLVTKFCGDLCRSKDSAVRIRKDNPARDVAGPDRGRVKTKQWLYPKELDQLLACQKVPVERRRLYALHVYLFCRVGEVLPMTFDHSIDLEHGMVTIDRKQSLRTGEVDHFTKADKKNSEARSFAIEPILLPMLRAMRRELGPSAPFFKECKHGAKKLRDDLVRAGVTRQALLEENDPNSMALRMHDLRATGITYMAIRGDSDHDVRERAGHSDMQTTLMYLRRGKRASAQIGTPFSPLPDSLSSTESSTSGSGGGNSDGSEGEEAQKSRKNSGKAVENQVQVLLRPPVDGPVFSDEQVSDRFDLDNNLDDRATGTSFDGGGLVGPSAFEAYHITGGAA